MQDKKNVRAAYISGFRDGLKEGMVLEQLAAQAMRAGLLDCLGADTWEEQVQQLQSALRAAEQDLDNANAQYEIALDRNTGLCKELRGNQQEIGMLRVRAAQAATLEARNRVLEAELALRTEQLASATSRLNELDTPAELERMAESMKEVVKPAPDDEMPDPGPDHYLLKEGDVIEAGDEFLNEENGEWKLTDCEGQHVGETTNFGAVVRFYRRRKPQTNG